MCLGGPVFDRAGQGYGSESPSPGDRNLWSSFNGEGPSKSTMTNRTGAPRLLEKL